MQLRYNLSWGDNGLPICYCSSCHTQGVLTSSQIDLDPAHDPTISYPAHLNDPIDDGLSQSSKGRSISTADTWYQGGPILVSGKPEVAEKSILGPILAG